MDASGESGDGLEPVNPQRDRLSRWAGGLGAGVLAGLVASQAFGPVSAAPMDGLGWASRPVSPSSPSASGASLEPLHGAAMVRFRGSVGSGIYRSARSAGASPGAVQQYLRALDRRLLLEEDVLPTDGFDLVIARRSSGTVRAGDLLYAGLEREGRPRVQLLRWGKDGRLVAPTDLAVPGATAAPVAGRITSRFGPRRHPILGYVRMHAGIDIKAPFGAPVRASADGRVVFAGRHGGHGTYIRLAHSGTLGSGYAHLSRLAVSPGMAVRAGEVIGYVGSSGLSTGPHLHYELYRGGRAVDPHSGPALAAVTDSREGRAVRARLAALLRVPASVSQPTAAVQPPEFASIVPAAD